MFILYVIDMTEVFWNYESSPEDTNQIGSPESYGILDYDQTWVDSKFANWVSWEDYKKDLSSMSDDQKKMIQYNLEKRWYDLSYVRKGEKRSWIDGDPWAITYGAIETFLAKALVVKEKKKVLNDMWITQSNVLHSIENEIYHPWLAWYIKYVEQARWIAPPVTPDMFIASAHETWISLITPEVLMAIVQHETWLGTDCLKHRKIWKTKYIKNGETKRIRYTYYNIWNVQYKNPTNWKEGIQLVADNLSWRFREFTEQYPDKKPTIVQILKNQWPDGKWFLSSQANFKKNNKNAMWAYCADESLWETVGDQVYPNTISSIMRKISSFS